MLRLVICLPLVACFTLPAVADDRVRDVFPDAGRSSDTRTGQYMVVMPAAQPADGKPVAFLGVTCSQAPVALSRQVDLPDGFGLVVDTVHADSPAAGAGLERHDLLYKFDDQLLVNSPQLVTLVRSKKIGDTVELTVIRKGEHEKLSVTVGERPTSLSAINSGYRIHAQPFPIHATPTPVHRHAFDEAIRKQIEQTGHVDAETIRAQMRKAIENQRANLDIGAAPGVAKAFVSSSQVNWSDRDHRIHLSEKDGVKNLIVSTTDGDVLYDGAPSADEDGYAALPAEVRDKVRKVMGMTKPGGFINARVNPQPVEVDAQAR